MKAYVCEKCGFQQTSMTVNFCENCGIGRKGYYDRILECPYCGCLPTNRVSKLGETFCCKCGMKKRSGESLDFACQEDKMWETTEFLITQKDRPQNSPIYIYHCPACGIGASRHDGNELGKPQVGPVEKWLRASKRALHEWYEYNGAFWTPVFMAFLLVGGIFLWGYSVTNQEFDGKISNSGEAVALCQVVVKEFLKDSGSASFSNYSAQRSSSGGWISSGTVSAKNSFGAIVKSRYSCTLSDTNVTSISVR